VKSRLGHIREAIAGTAVIAFTLLTPFLKSWHSRWGATGAEVKRPLPGDDLVPQSKGGYTHAVTIHAPASEVWPWVVQIGQGRGGYYSYELLENLTGCNIHNADDIMPGFQRLGVGDSILMHPKNPNPYKVAAIEPGRVLVLLIRVDAPAGGSFEPGHKAPRTYQNQSWVLFLEETGEGTTRLISRSRNDYAGGLANTLLYGFFGPVSLVMDRKMLMGIKQRAEKQGRGGRDKRG